MAADIHSASASPLITRGAQRGGPVNACMGAPFQGRAHSRSRWDRSSGLHGVSLAAMSTAASSSSDSPSSSAGQAASAAGASTGVPEPATPSPSATASATGAGGAAGSQQLAGPPLPDNDVQIGWQQMGKHGTHGLVLSGGAFVLPHPEKMAKGGEDWYFIASNRRAVGVADGVGGWAEVGVDAGAYARSIMNNASTVADRATNGDGAAAAALSAQTILEQAYNMTNVMGSSTACVMVLNGATLSGSNLGDSGFMVIRAGEMVMATQQQQHSFNFPFQLGGAEAMGDHPAQAERYDVTVQEGDIIVAGTDGLWDNCFHEEILSVIKYCREGDMSPERAAQVLAHYARHRASDTKFASPFSYAAYQAGIRYMGGKLDDITILVAFVEQAPPLQPASKL